ncbi:MAG: CBS domain-containing protein, partial [Gaiellaceae bacterium]
LTERFGPGARILSMIPDSGRSYLSKFYDDNWMLEYGFLERRAPVPPVEEVLRDAREDGVPGLVAVGSHHKVSHAIEVMQRYGISQLVVARNDSPEVLSDIVGSLNERGLLERVFTNGDALNEDVAAAMQPPLAAVEASESIDRVFAELTGGAPAVVVAREGKPVGVVTRSDLLEFVAHNR